VSDASSPIAFKSDDDDDESDIKLHGVNLLCAHGRRCDDDDARGE